MLSIRQAIKWNKRKRIWQNAHPRHSPTGFAQGMTNAVDQSGSNPDHLARVEHKELKMCGYIFGILVLFIILKIIEEFEKK